MEPHEKRRITERCLAAMRPGETPVPIPNTMVKPGAADGTLLETARESRWLPDIKKKRVCVRPFGLAAVL